MRAELAQPRRTPRAPPRTTPARAAPRVEHPEQRRELGRQEARARSGRGGVPPHLREHAQAPRRRLRRLRNWRCGRGGAADVDHASWRRRQQPRVYERRELHCAARIARTATGAVSPACSRVATKARSESGSMNTRASASDAGVPTSACHPCGGFARELPTRGRARVPLLELTTARVAASRAPPTYCQQAPNTMHMLTRPDCDCAFNHSNRSTPRT